MSKKSEPDELRYAKKSLERSYEQFLHSLEGAYYQTLMQAFSESNGQSIEVEIGWAGKRQTYRLTVELIKEEIEPAPKKEKKGFLNFFKKS